MANHVIAPRTYYQVFAVLIALTLATVGVDLLERYGYVSLGAFHTPFVLSIAVVKAALVILFFMHVLYSLPLTWVVALSSLLWLAILIGYTMTDYMTRSWLRVPGH